MQGFATEVRNNVHVLCTSHVLMTQVIFSIENMTSVTSQWKCFDHFLTVSNKCKSFIRSLLYFFFFPPGYTVEEDVTRTDLQSQQSEKAL